jgi:tetratricopeptide (TPR) repeat protein
LGSSRRRLQTSLGNALIWAKGYTAPETGAAFARARELASRVEDASERFSAYYGLWGAHLNRCEPAPMREMAELFLCEATARLNCPETLIAHRIFGVTCFHFGHFPAAHEHFQKTLELYDKARHSDFANRFGQNPRAEAEIYDALALWVIGQIDEALLLAQRALADAEAAAHAPTMAHALAFAARLELLRYNPEAVETHSQALADIVSRYDLPAFWAGLAVFFQGWATWSDDAEASRLAEMRRGIAINREQGIYNFAPEPKPEHIVWYRTASPTLALSRGLERDRGVDETGHQIAVFGRIGSRPFTLDEMKKFYLGPGGSLFTVTVTDRVKVEDFVGPRPSMLKRIAN